MALRASRKTRKLNPGVYARPDGKYQAHITIPNDVRFAYGRDKRVISLKTDDPDEANRRHANLIAEHQAAFDLIRRGTASRAFEAFALRLHESQSEVIAADNDRVFKSRLDTASNVWLSSGIGHRLDTRDPEELAATVGWAADWFYAEQLGVDPDSLPDELRSSIAYRQVLRECAEVLRDSWRAGKEAESGRTVSPPRHPALSARATESPDGNRAKDDRATWPTSRYHEEVYLPGKAGRLADTVIKNKRQTIQLFGELIGDPALFMLTQAQVADFREQLRFLPDGRLAGAATKGKTLREVVELQRSGALQIKRQAAGTIDKHVQNIKAMLAYAKEEGHITLNPALGMRGVVPTVENPKRDRRPFSRKELEAIFALPMFAGCEADTDRGQYRPGPVLIRDERFWIPILLFLTGARAKEIAGLEKSEVVIAGETARLVFKFTELRRLKNAESERVIPLHPWAMKMGFGDYVASLPTDTTALFPKVMRSGIDPKSGRIEDAKLNGTAVFRQFNRTLLKSVGLADDPTTSLHSFRHVFEDAMTGRDIPEEVMFRLTGRSVGGSRKIYAKSLPADEDRREQRATDYMRHVEKIDFGGIDISSLFKK